MLACGKIYPFFGINWKERHWRHDLFLVAGQTFLRTADHAGRGYQLTLSPWLGAGAGSRPLAPSTASMHCGSAAL